MEQGAGAYGRHVWAVPLRTRFRGILVREGVLIEGPAGWGEFSPFWDYDVRQCAPWLRAAQEAAYDGWPPPLRDHVPVNATVPAVGPDLAADIVRLSGGCTTAKVKVAEPGQSEADDLARLEAVRDALGPAGTIRIDVNGLWDVDTALRCLPRYARAAGGLEYVEQPCRTLDELATVRRRTDVPVAADESIRRADDPLLVALAGAADVAVLKVAPLGGVRACLEIAERCGLPVVVSSALESSVGLAAGVALAAALPELPYACGLATAALLGHDLVDDPFRPVDGALSVRRPVPTPALLAAHEAGPDARWRWRERMAQAGRA